MARKRRRWILVVVVVSLIVVVGWIGIWLAGNRQADCGAFGNERAGTICRALSDNMQFDWLGHAVIDPGYKVTFESVRRVYCEQKVGAEDLPALEQLLSAPDWRIRNGADFLIRLVTGHDPYGTPEPEISIFNPGNPSYLLGDGCNA